MRWRKSPEQRVDDLEWKMQSFSGRLDTLAELLKNHMNLCQVAVGGATQVTAAVQEQLSDLAGRVQAIEDDLAGVDEEMEKEAVERLEDPEAKHLPFIMQVNRAGFHRTSSKPPTCSNCGGVNFYREVAGDGWRWLCSNCKVAIEP